VNWVGTPDFPGSIVSKAYGMNADKLPSTLDNTEIYKLMYQTLFGTDSRQDLVSGTAGADKLLAGVTPGFDGVNDLVFTGAGNDEVDVAIAGSIAGKNRIDLGSGNDITYVANGDRAFGSAGDDLFEATDAKDYRISGGAGNDTLFLGANGRALGGDGNDKLFVGTGGGNILSGGAGANTIVDFQLGTDVLGFTGKVKFTDLIRTGNNISIGGNTIATLTGIETNTLTSANFAFI
jgi:glycerophosphoryl diester phosphodiesterase